MSAAAPGSPAAPAAGRLAPRPRRRGPWVAIAMLTAVVLLVPAGARLWLKADLQQLRLPVSVYRRPIAVLQVDAPVGDVAISTGKSGQVTVTSTVTWAFARPVVVSTWHGGQLQVSARCPQPDLFGDCQADFAIQVPAGTTVRTDAGAGDVQVTGLTGPALLAVTSGSIEMTNITGPVTARATSGSISASGLACARFAATVTSGSLAVSFDRAPQQLALAVGSGSAEATVPQGTRYRVTARGQGRPVMAAGLASAAAAGSIAAVVGPGTLRIGYPLG